MHLFVSKPERKPPLINRGYYSRVTAVRRVLDDFLHAGNADGSARPKQVISLGAGFDTLYFNYEMVRFPSKCNTAC